jgi:predicted transcriptional regulator YdeE
MGMDARVISADEWLLVGMSFFGDPFSVASGWSEDNEIGLLWKRFSAFYAQNPDAIKHIVNPSMMMEVHLWTEETEEKGLSEVFVGTRVDRLEDVPLKCVVKVLPATLYAVLTLVGDQITSDWGKLIYQDWMVTSGYRSTHQYMIECYDERFKGVDRIPESVLDAYVPVEKTG